jgi:hypothetical protein
VSEGRIFPTNTPQTEQEHPFLIKFPSLETP